MVLQLSGFGDQKAEVRALLEPAEGDAAAHEFRVRKLRDVISSRRCSADEVRELLQFTQFDGETHRLLAPQLRAALLNGGDREYPLSYASINQPTRTSYDVIIVGTGPHGVAVASYVRERKPAAAILMLDQNPKIGGQFGQYGGKPVFQMNSRVREANRLLPPVPRTPASINPLGKYAPFELSDIAMGSYAWNTEIANVTAWSAWMSASEILLDAKVTGIYSQGGTYQAYLYYDKPGYAEQAYLEAKVIVDATGISQHSRLSRQRVDQTSFEFAERTNRLFNTGSLYKYFGTVDNPLELFHNRQVLLVGAGDSALTVLEALVGNLPASSYGTASVSRNRPTGIQWFGAPNTTQRAIEKCLRARYKNGVVQNLPRNIGEVSLIRPSKMKGNTYRATGDKVYLRAGIDQQEFEGDILIDCTNSTQQIIAEKRTSSLSWNPTYKVGPYANDSLLSYETKVLIERLGVPENTASLWATMPITDRICAATVSRI